MLGLLTTCGGILFSRVFMFSCAVLISHNDREFTQRRRRRRQREWLKRNRFNLDKQNNNFARRFFRFFVHFFAVVARLQRESA